jgi:hypothetical protein
MTDEELEAIAKRVNDEPLYTNAWSRATMHQARLDRHALLGEVKRLRVAATSGEAPQ